VGGFIVGFALSCEAASLATVYLGTVPGAPPGPAAGDPHRRRRGNPVRTGVPRRRGERVPQPQLAGDDLDEFLRAVLAPGTLVSNGYSSYRVQLTPAERTRLTTFLEDCGR